MDRLKDKVAIITGSTSGIGLGIAKAFAKEGATVIITGRRKERGEKIVGDIIKDKGKASYHFLDVTKVETIKELIDDTVNEYGKIDVLVNNAAIGYLWQGSGDGRHYSTEGYERDGGQGLYIELTDDQVFIRGRQFEDRDGVSKYWYSPYQLVLQLHR